jgi:CubicO group peptidase (beta-lactamase class C family)
MHPGHRSTLKPKRGCAARLIVSTFTRTCAFSLARAFTLLATFGIALLLVPLVSTAWAGAAENGPASGAGLAPEDGLVPSDGLAAEIDAIMVGAYPAGEPGAAIIVTRGGETLLRKGYGQADLELDVPVEADMVFRIGSVTKQFTAIAVLMLVEDGKLALDDRIDMHLPGYPMHDRAITIEHLLTHTSGIKSYTAQEQFLEKMRQDYTVDEMIARFQDEPLEFEPGEKWAYSNSGYYLLGAIIEKASGLAWDEFLQQRIFDVAGMTSSYAGRHERVIPRRLRGYEPDPELDGWRNALYLSMTQPYAAGAILSTVDDLARWQAALSAGQLVGEDMLEKAWAGGTLNDGSATGYGFGWFIGEWRGSRVISHGGGINGFLSETIHCPEEDVFVAVLSNRSGGAGPGAVARKAAALAMGKPWDPRPVAVHGEILRRYAGVYRIDAETAVTLTLEEGQLVSQRTGGARRPALPLSATGFFFEDAFSHFEIELDPDSPGGEAIRGMTLYTMGGRPTFAALTDEEPATRTAIELDPATLDRYLGRYELMPTFILTVSREGNQLWLQATGQPQVAIFPESPTLFFAGEVDAQIEFDFDPDGHAKGLTLYQAGHELPARRLED